MMQCKLNCFAEGGVANRANIESSHLQALEYLKPRLNSVIQKATLSSRFRHTRVRTRLEELTIGRFDS